MRNDVKFGADSPEVADEVLNERFQQMPGHTVGRLIGWVLLATLFVLGLGAALLMLGGAVYLVYRLALWMLGWF